MYSQCKTVSIFLYSDNTPDILMRWWMENVTFAYLTNLAQNYYFYIIHYLAQNYFIMNLMIMIISCCISAKSQQAHRRVLVLEGSVNFITKWWHFKVSHLVFWLWITAVMSVRGKNLKQSFKLNVSDINLHIYNLQPTTACWCNNCFNNKLYFNFTNWNVKVESLLLYYLLQSFRSQVQSLEVSYFQFDQQ